MEVVKHVVGKLGQSKFMGVPDSLLVWFFYTKMVESDPQRFQTDAGKFAEVHRIFAEDSGVDPLIKIHPTLHWRSTAIALELCSGCKPEVSDFRDNFLESARGDDIVVHEDEIFLLPIEAVDLAHEAGEGLGVALRAF